MTFDALDVVVIPFPFTDRADAKRRPALVVSSRQFNRGHQHAVLAMITTAAGTDWPSDVPLRDWSKAGLSVPCRVRLKLFTLDAALVIKRLGALSDRDRLATRRALRRFLALA